MSNTGDRIQLPHDVHPQLACWFPTDLDLRPGGYRTMIERLARHSPFRLLTTSIRHPLGFMSSEDGVRFFAEAAAFARDHGIGLVLDLCVRHFRDLFASRYPNEQQEILKLEHVDLTDSTGSVCRIQSDSNPGDHYTAWGDSYRPLSGRLVRVFSYDEQAGQVDPSTVMDITESCRVDVADETEVRAYIPNRFRGRAVKKAAVLVCFTHLAPDVFSPHLLEFQREILRLYAGMGLAGACKDEWGFMAFNWSSRRMEEFGEFFYSRWYAEAYRSSTQGRDLADDLFLMSRPQLGRDVERQRAINHYMRTAYLRHVEVETDFYNSCKEIFGEHAFVGTHPTWWPYPGAKEFIHDGLHWWAAPRDVAQTDECTPISVATALAKKWNSPIWYNMYYDSMVDTYIQNVWRYGALGGRLNYHPLYPCSKEGLSDAMFDLLGDELMRAECRIRLLNFIAKAPIDCRVAVVFGHTAAMNWAGPYYDDTGEELALKLWQAGFPTDMIPSSEIAHFTVDAGRVKYGPQHYDVVVLYHLEYEPEKTAELLKNAFLEGGTHLFLVGEWTKNFDAEPVQFELPGPIQMTNDLDHCAQQVVEELKARGIRPQTPFENPLVWRAAPELTQGKRLPPDVACYRMIDGTRVFISASRNRTGDPISKRLEIDGHAVHVKAEGVLGIRLTDKGEIEAVAAGGLRLLACGELQIELEQATDIAFWRDGNGRMRGVLQAVERPEDGDHPVPEALLQLTADWSWIYLPVPMDSETHIANERRGAIE